MVSRGHLKGKETSRKSVYVRIFELLFQVKETGLAENV